MGIITIAEGCRGDLGCMGPAEGTIFIFNTPLFMIWWPLLLSLIPAMLLFGLLWFLKKKGKISWQAYALFLIASAVFLLLFWLTASMTWIVY